MISDPTSGWLTNVHTVYVPCPPAGWGSGLPQSCVLLRRSRLPGRGIMTSQRNKIVGPRGAHLSTVIPSGAAMLRKSLVCGRSGRWEGGECLGIRGYDDWTTAVACRDGGVRRRDTTRNVTQTTDASLLDGRTSAHGSFLSTWAQPASKLGLESLKSANGRRQRSQYPWQIWRRLEGQTDECETCGHGGIFYPVVAIEKKCRISRSVPR